YFILNSDQTVNYYNTRSILQKICFTPDIVIVLFMQHFLNFKNLYELNSTTGAPILLYMMDMAPMTGGCHYSWECKGYHDKCGRCPGMNSLIEDDNSRRNWSFKREFVSKTNITAIAASEWQFDQLKLSSMFREKLKKKV